MLGYSILVTEPIVKLPQVSKILEEKSRQDMNLFAPLELMAISLDGSYSFRNNFPRCACGERISSGIEKALIVHLVLQYDEFQSQSIGILT